jgi:site-specific DNA recombinase
VSLLRCAAYARYSSDRQSPASIEDQLRKCREFATKQSGEVLADHIYTDEELSGAGTDRPGWMRLLSAIAQDPRPFDVLLVDDTSRLFRNQGDAHRFKDDMRFLGVRFVAVSQGIDSEDEQSDVLMAVHGMVDELFIKELAKKTHRGLEGRALKGLNTGGSCYGYDNVPVPTVLGADGAPAVRRQVKETEATVLLRISGMYADGVSLKGIAKTLNAEQVAPPRKRDGRRFGTWCPSAIREMLRRELYAGHNVWNRRHFIKKPGTNKRVSRERPKSDWVITEQPELRIIDKELWERVQKRIAWVNRSTTMGIILDWRIVLQRA